MADPTTQSHQISSSQGLKDGHSKDCTFSDSFFSSSPVSFIQSSQEKRVTLDSEKPSEGVPTSLRFSSQPTSYFPATYGNANSSSSIGIKERSFQEKREIFESSLASQPQDSSPVKISPVSERIRALEALAAKHNDSDWSDAVFSNYRERHTEKSHSEIHGIVLRSSVKKKPTSSEQESPESPFEILGDGRRESDFEDTADWMRAHLPPAPKFNMAESDFDEIKGSSAIPKCQSDETESKYTDIQRSPLSYVGVPDDEFLNNPDELSKQMNDDCNQSKQDSAEDESEFDLRFLPTAYMWDKQVKPDISTQNIPLIFETQDMEIGNDARLDEVEVTTLESTAPVTKVATNAKQSASSLFDGNDCAEILDADSSGESDDTVIEDEICVRNDDSVECGFSAEKQNIPNELEKKHIQVPIINVIETEEQVLSDYEVEYEEEEQEEEEEQRYSTSQDQEPLKQREVLSDVSRSELEDFALKTHDVSSPENIAELPKDCSFKHQIINDDVNKDLINQTSTVSNSSENSRTQSIVPQGTEVTSTQSAFLNEESDKTTEAVPDLSNEVEPSDIEICLDNYTSEELALKDQLNSGVYSPNNEENELIKCNSRQSEHNIVLAENLYEETVQEFDKLVDGSREHHDTEPEPFPADILSDVPVEPLLSQNGMQYRELNDPGIVFENQQTITKEGNAACPEEELPSFEESTPAEISSFHSDPSPKISDVISDANEVLLMTNTGQDEIIRCDTPKSEETTYIPVLTEIESTQSEMFQICSPDTHKSEESTHIPVLTEIESTQSEMFQISAPDRQKSEDTTNIPVLIETESTKIAMFQNSSLKAQISEETANISENTGAESENFQCSAQDMQVSQEIPSSTEAESSATDSFVEFMRECLKSHADEDSQNFGQVQSTEEVISVCTLPAIDLEKECPPICGLKEHGNNHEVQDDGIPNDIPVYAKDTLSQHLLQSESFISTNPCLPNENQQGALLSIEMEGIDIWVAEAYHLAEHVLALILIHLTVHDLVYWREPKKSGVVFGISLLLLLSLAAFSVISVISYMLLALLCVTISFRIYKSVMQAVQKSNEGHPFKELIDKDIALPPESFRKHVDTCLTYINCALKQLSRLFLVEDLVDSLKLAVGMWLMTYVGAVFNGITVLILVDILAFTVPPLYEKYKTQIDRYIDIVRTQVNTAVAKIQEKLPKSLKRSKKE